MAAKIIISILALALVGCGLIARQNQPSPTVGLVNGALRPLPDKPNCVSSQAKDPDKRVAPWPYLVNTGATMAKIIDILEKRSDVTIMQADSHYLHAVFTTRIMHFKDDVEFLLDDEQQIVHFRSASRVGYSDLGANRKRYESLYSEYKNGENE